MIQSGQNLQCSGGRLVSSLGLQLARLRDEHGYSFEAIENLTGIRWKRLVALEGGAKPKQKELEAVLEVMGQALEAIREIKQHIGPVSLENPVSIVQVLPSEQRGFGPWAQAVYGTELREAGPIRTVQCYLSSLMRPMELTLKQFEWDGVSSEDLESMRAVLTNRRNYWLKTLEMHVCKHIYPKKAVENYFRERVWLGRTLEREQIAKHIRAVIDELEQQPNFEIGLLSGEDWYFNFFLRADYVLVEGGCVTEPEPQRRFVGGLRISGKPAIEAFAREFDRLWARIPEEDRSKAHVITWLKNQHERVLGR